MPKISPPTLPPPPSGQVISPKPEKKFSVGPRFLVFVLILLIIGGGIWFFMTGDSEEVVITTPTPTPTPRPKNLSELITSTNQITISSTENFQNALKTQLALVKPPLRQFIAIEIMDENGSIYSISQIFQKLNISPPSGILESLDQGEWKLFLYGQSEVFSSQGAPTFLTAESMPKLGLVAKSLNPTALRSGSNNWEATITNDLKTLFDLDPNKATSQLFLDNFYRDTAIRYRNFPFADKSIDYGIADLIQFDASYYILTSSRESIYSLIDLLETQ